MDSAREFEGTFGFVSVFENSITFDPSRFAKTQVQ